MSGSVLAVALCALVLASGCGDSGPAPPDGDAEYAGIVRDVDEDGRVLVRPDDDPDCGILFKQISGVEVLRQTGDSFETAAWEDLAPGMVVEVWINGDGIAASCPGGGAADAIAILE